MAQEIPFAVKDKTRYSQAGMVGYTEIDSVRYSQLRLIQEFRFWKIKMGLDLDFLFDKNYHLRQDNWDNLEDVLNKFYYVQYADKNEPFYFHLGGFPGLTLGNGLIMQNYSNMQLYPALRNTGLMVGIKPNLPLKPSFELFSSNLVRNPTLSLTGRFKPLPDSTVKVIGNIELGFSIVTDTNQYGTLKYYTADSLMYLADGLKRNSATVMGFSYSLPIYKNDKVTLHQYSELAHIDGHGTGFILPGIFADFGFISANLEYRIYGKEFTPGYFSRNYEENRAIIVSDTLGVQTQEDGLNHVKATQGWNGSIQSLLFDRVKARVAWQNTFGEDLKTGKSLWLSLGVNTQYKRLENFSLSYSKTNTDRLAIGKLTDPNTEIGGSITFRVIKKRWFMIAKYSERYKEKDVVTRGGGAKETNRAMGLGVKYLIK